MQPDPKPYSSANEEELNLSIKETSQLKGLNEAIKLRFIPWHQNLKGVIKINDVKQFSDEIQQLGKTFGCSYLVDYGSRLMKTAELFDITGIKSKLSYFQKITDGLERMEQNHV